MKNLFAAIAGGLFGAGLLVSGMTDTDRVRGWLDVFGAWDPTLAFVMGGAIMPMALAWRLTRDCKPLTRDAFPPPPEPRLGHNLVLGSVLFGIGWGLVGFCPGPALAALGFGGPAVWIFAVAMVAGMAAAPLIRLRVDALAGSA